MCQNYVFYKKIEVLFDHEEFVKKTQTLLLKLKQINNMATSNTTFTMPKTADEANRIGVSLCIPRVFNNINHRRIKSWFIQNLRGWGFVERVDVVPVYKNGVQVHKRAYVHYAVGKFNMKADDGNGGNIIDALVAGNQIQVIYDEPWYWKLSLSKAARPAEAPKRRVGPAVKIELKGESVYATEQKEPDMHGAAALAGYENTPTAELSSSERSEIARAPTLEHSQIDGKVCRDMSCDEEEWTDAN